MSRYRPPKIYAYPSLLIIVAFIGLVLTPIGFLFIAASLPLAILLTLLRRRWTREGSVSKLDLSSKISPKK